MIENFNETAAFQETVDTGGADASASDAQEAADIQDASPAETQEAMQDAANGYVPVGEVVNDLPPGEYVDASTGKGREVGDTSAEDEAADDDWQQMRETTHPSTGVRFRIVDQVRTPEAEQVYRDSGFYSSGGGEAATDSRDTGAKPSETQEGSQYEDDYYDDPDDTPTYRVNLVKEVPETPKVSLIKVDIVKETPDAEGPSLIEGGDQDNKPAETEEAKDETPEVDPVEEAKDEKPEDDAAKEATDTDEKPETEAEPADQPDAADTAIDIGLPGGSEAGGGEPGPEPVVDEAGASVERDASSAAEAPTGAEPETGPEGGEGSGDSAGETPADVPVQPAFTPERVAAATEAFRTQGVAFSAAPPEVTSEIVNEVAAASVGETDGEVTVQEITDEGGVLARLKEAYVTANEAIDRAEDRMVEAVGNVYTRLNTAIAERLGGIGQEIKIEVQERIDPRSGELRTYVVTTTPQGWSPAVQEHATDAQARALADRAQQRLDRVAAGQFGIVTLFDALGDLARAVGLAND